MFPWPFVNIVQILAHLGAGQPMRTPFGIPDGSRTDIQEVVENFVSFDPLNVSTGLDIHPDELIRFSL